MLIIIVDYIVCVSEDICVNIRPYVPKTICVEIEEKRIRIQPSVLMRSFTTKT